jgi:hypothetical protein
MSTASSVSDRASVVVGIIPVHAASNSDLCNETCQNKDVCDARWRYLDFLFRLLIDLLQHRLQLRFIHFALNHTCKSVIAAATSKIRHSTSLRIHYQKVLDLARFVSLDESDVGNYETLLQKNG